MVTFADGEFGTDADGTRTSRRHFLRGMALSGAATVLGAGLVSAGCVNGSRERSEVDDLERRLPGRVLRPGSAGYAAFTTPWNLRWSAHRPVAMAVVRARSAADVAATLRWATDTGTPVVARSGGHSYGGFSTTRGVTIDVSSMGAASYDAATGHATVGGGVRNSGIYRALAAVDRTVTHGRCYGVGVSGLVLGGGVGFNMRRFGLTCDQLVGTTLVLADGKVVQADAEKNPDLFWAARGAGGGNFGIHTEFTFQTQPAGEIVVFDLTYTTALEELLSAVLGAAFDAPRQLGLKVTVRATPGSGAAPKIELNLLGQWAGPRGDLDSWLAPFQAIAEPDRSRGFLRTEPYWQGQKGLSDPGRREYMYERSQYATDELGPEAVATVFEQLRRWPTTKVAASWKGFLAGGAIKDVAADATAFVHRADWLLSTVDLNWSEADSPTRVETGLKWVDGFHAAMVPHTSDRAYQNFIDPTQAGWARSYYGANLERLVAIKQKVDPNNVFSFAQSIPLRAPS